MERERARFAMHKLILAGSLAGCLGAAVLAEAVLAESGLPGRPTVDPGVASYEPKADLRGGLVIAGSDTMQPTMAKLASAFQQFHPGTKLGVEGGGTEKTLMKFISDQSAIRRGDADVGAHQVSGSVGLMASSRQLTPEEVADFRARYGYEPTAIPIAMDAVAIYVNRANPLQGLTLDQVDDIFGSQHKRGGTTDITTWGQLGLSGEWEKQPIHLYGRDRQSGTRTFFMQVALNNGDLKPTVKEEPGSASEILAISRDPLALGYAGIGFQASFVRAVPLAEKSGMPFILPSAEAAASGAYPLGRPLYLYVKKDPLKALEPVILEFLRFVNSREGQLVVVKAGAYPLPASQVAKNLQVLTGTGLASALTR